MSEDLEFSAARSWSIDSDPLKFNKSSKVSRPPIALPRRSSSLAFSPERSPPSNEVLNSHEASAIQSQTRLLRSDADEQRSLCSLPHYDRPSSKHLVQVQRSLHLAQATLHRDVQVASSPASSIESRLNLDQRTLLPGILALRTQIGTISDSAKTWRYSVAPEVLTTSSIDVREPLPLPALSGSLPTQDFDDDIGVEPASSGFSTPYREAVEYDLPLIGSSDNTMRSTHGTERDAPSPENRLEPELIAELDRPMADLEVDSIDGAHMYCSSNDDSPILRHLRKRSDGSCPDMYQPHSPERGLILPEVAEAAAHSARANRRHCRAQLTRPKLVQRSAGIVLCPDPGAHKEMPDAYPGALEHDRSKPVYYAEDVSIERVGLPLPIHQVSPFERHSNFQSDVSDYPDSPLRNPIPSMPRITATGSPMPFLHSTRIPKALDCRLVSTIPSSPGHRSLFMTANEHFQPGWYYASEASDLSRKPVYSFSTAAAKVRAEDQAPDLRMRDSYKTNTLTALPKSQSRFRKNGIGASVAVRGIGRQYQRQPLAYQPPRVSSRPNSRQTYSTAKDVRFGSSPPSSMADVSSYNRKRAADDSLMGVENLRFDRPRHDRASLPQPNDEEFRQINESSQAAIRMSTSCTNTPETLQSARLDIRELSPNVQIYRKGDPRSRSRKKRRPSYWDQDLEEIRNSPAARRAVESSASTKQSLEVEFGVASTKSTMADDEENDLDEQIRRLSFTTNTASVLESEVDINATRPGQQIETHQDIDVMEVVID